MARRSAVRRCAPANLSSAEAELVLREPAVDRGKRALRLTTWQTKIIPSMKALEPMTMERAKPISRDRVSWKTR